MPRPMRTSKKGLELIKSFEGFRARSVQLPSGTWVIGYGHTKSARANLRVAPEDAELILRFRDLKPIEQLITERVLCPLSQAEFDALVSFIFNIGEEAFIGSDVLNLLNRGDRLAAAEAMSVWRKGEIDGEMIVVDVFVRRRAAEKALFLEHPSGRVPLATAMVRPQRDDDFRAPNTGQAGALPDAERENTRRAPIRESSPEVAARAVSARLTRIVEEVEENSKQPVLPPPPPASDDALPETELDEPSIDEITRAISALADPAAPDDDLPEPPGLSGPPKGVERRRPLTPPSTDLPPVDLDPLTLTDEVLPAIGADVIDDTVVVEVSDDDIQRALEENGTAIEPIGNLPGVLHWLPFALLSGLGMIGFIAGLLRMFEPSLETAGARSATYVGAILALGGGFLLFISAYYLFRALTRAD